MTLGKGIEQLYVFAVLTVVGVVLSAVYIFGYGLTKKSHLAALLFDGIFGCLALWIVWRVNLEVNNGEFRLFVFLALGSGCALTYFTCKSALDKASLLLYNLFTKLTVDETDGTHFQQKKLFNNVRGSAVGAGATGMHATGNADSDVSAKSTRRTSKRTHRRGKRTR